ncbi:FkbH-like protein [Sphingomonas vulcanisoli]|uniref:FkbH-like protein n=1 Tax=Sphingomonas vulcanisoli TaxID=1658060 RepID=A0ABX0TYX9_9SPHN|nr:HAD-IIIC family phosphatase [Sphingomonas vulcanisoli]NIJ09605.1 FkbH-like protein [Sphingomonas vulcanisoli]
MIKLIIWDLDDTLWRGTLADGDDVQLFDHRAALIRAFNAKGVVSAICSKNDFATARAKLEALGLWDEFVFPHIAFTPKPQAIEAIIADMQLRAPDVLFVDDNPLNLNEVRHRIPDIQILDITTADADNVLAEALAQAKGTKSRVPEYRILEAKRADRAAAGQLSDADFLRASEIKVCAPFCMETLDYVDRIVELINRSNQLNYTQSRVTADSLRDQIIDVIAHPCLALFASDKYGDYGLIGFVMLRNLGDGGFDLVHFTFSCRAMHMGMEQYALDELTRRAVTLYPPVPPLNHPAFAERFARTPSYWIERIPYANAASAQLLSAYVEGLLPDPAIRIICNCQSGGLAHYSRHRADIAFDNHPRIFTMRQMCEPGFADPAFPAHVVYGAGVDYESPRWDALADLLDNGLFAQCVHALCQLWTASGTRALVILPAENLVDHQYYPWMGISRARTIAFNAIWREMFDIYPCVSLVESQELHAPDEVKDVNHLLPGAVRKFAALIDLWYDQLAAENVPEMLAA